METYSTEQTLSQLQAWYKTNQDRFYKSYFDLLRIASVSTEKEHIPQIQACATELANRLRTLGFDVEFWGEPGVPPTVYATLNKAGPNKPTVLIYNHYDVQPVDPLELWQTPPFEPSLRNGEVFARGAQDNKGQLAYVLHAIEYLLTQENEMPVNLKLCIEGEEEIGSTSLINIAQSKQRELQADHLFIVDMGIPDKDTPAVTLGLRGCTFMTVEFTGSSTDLHSGEHGGLVYNPNRALVEVLAKLHDSHGRVTIPGFYDDALPMTDEERRTVDLTFDEKLYETEFGTKLAGREEKYSPLESIWARPTCEFNGICGGYSGPGFKTVIPAKAIAKISCRLVPNQNPEKIQQLLQDFIKEHTPPSIQVTFETSHGGYPPVRATSKSNAVQAVAKAYEDVFKTPCKFILAGGSVGVVSKLQEYSQAETVLFGMGLSNDQIHAPNEHFGLDRLEKGFLVLARSLQILGENSSQP